jgi:hypothetical protein
MLPEKDSPLLGKSHNQCCNNKQHSLISSLLNKHNSKHFNSRNNQNKNINLTLVEIN